MITRDRSTWKWFAALIGLTLCGCAELLSPIQSVTEPLGLSEPMPRMTQSELHSELADFSARFGSVMGMLGERVLRDGASTDVRRRALVLRVQLLPLVQQHALDRNPRSGYVALLSLSVMLRLYVTADNDYLDFGPHKETVAASVRQLEDELVSLGSRFLESDRLEALRYEVERFARENQPTQGFTTARVEDSLIKAKKNAHLMRILELPMAPFRALSGVEQGPAAIRDFTQTARGFAAIVATLPMQLRWQADLLIHETLRSEAVLAALDALERTAGSAQRLSAASVRLPEELRETLAASEGPLRALDDTLVRLHSLLEPLRATSAELADAGVSWRRVFDNTENDRGTVETKQKLDLAALQQTAESIGEAALRIESAARSIGTLVEGSPQSGTHDDAKGQPIDARLYDLIDLAFGRIIMLLVLIFVLGLAYRFLALRIAARD